MTINPIAFQIFGLDIRWYGIIMATAIITGCVLTYRLMRSDGVEENDILDLFLFVIPSSIIGARLWYVLFNLDYYGFDLLKIINTRNGGMAIHGGIIAAVAVGYLFCRKRKLKFIRLIDFCAPGLALGQAIGRWGNFTNGEAHGGPTNLPWGIVVDGVRVHPTFLYESVWNLLVFVFLWRYKDKNEAEGKLFLIYMVLYGIGRFWIEGMRTDSLMVGSLRTAQLVSIAFVVAGIAGIRYLGGKSGKS